MIWSAPWPAIWPAALAVLALAILSAAVVRRMIGLAVLDVPGHRSAHDRPIPKGGGVGVLAALLLGTPLLLLLLPPAWHPPTGPVLALLAATAGLALVSWLDDLKQFRFAPKLLAQVGAALLALVAGATLLPPPWLGGGPLLLAAGAAVALLWMLYNTNALNFIDGLNGLASGSALLAALFAAAAGAFLADGLVVALGLSLAAGMAGFLPFNYPRARIFMGDVGSQGAGLLLGALALLLGRHGPWGLWAALVPMTLFGILWDVGFTLCRRARAGERLTEAHRGHLYQVASRSGVSRPAVAAIHWLFCMWGGLAWLGLALLPPEWKTAAALLVLPPQIGWTMLVRRLARRAGLPRWS